LHPSRIKISKVYGARCGVASNQVVEVSGTLAEGITTAESDGCISSRTLIPSAEALIRLIIFYHQDWRPNCSCLRGFVWKWWSDRVATKIVEREAAFKQCQAPFADPIQPFFISKDLE
jgi:hypothetical protein